MFKKIYAPIGSWDFIASFQVHMPKSGVKKQPKWT
jgi:hypothetical protein